MSDEQRARDGQGDDGGDVPGEPQVKVNDRRRFSADGELLAVEDASRPGTGADPATAPGASDPRDVELARQGVRIDELTRAYAALLDEGKAVRARLEREKARVLEAERAGVSQVLLEAVDELERALAAAGGAAGPLVDGVGLTLAALRKRVAELGAERLATLGQRFDPRLHDAVDLVPVSDPSQDDAVVQEVRAGYRVGDRVLRPARVRVGRFTAPPRQPS